MRFRGLEGRFRACPDRNYGAQLTCRAQIPVMPLLQQPSGPKYGLGFRGLGV